MGHIFISYSRHDTSYAHTLAENLQSMGFEIWIDERLDYGSQWPREIQKQLDACHAFILIMTPRSFSSDWVQSELQRAKRKLKPIFPLLLEGDEPWLSVESTQFYDVRGGGYPDSRFYSALKRVATPDPHVQSPLIPKRRIPAKPAAAPKRRFATETMVALIGAMATLCAALLGVLPFFREWLFPQKLDVTILLSLTSPANAAVLPIATTDMPEPASSVTATLVAAETATSTEPFVPSESATGTVTETIPATDTIVPTSPAVQSTIPPADLVPITGTETASAEMVLVPEGEFTMGYNGSPDANPEHPVFLISFYIDKYEVTNALYKACVIEGVCSMPSDHTAYNNPQFIDHPVVFVTWRQSKNYCEWRGARLPTEAEWEKAARGTDARNYPWGEGIDCTLANASGCKGGTSKVGSYEDGKSKYGAYDMAGNVSEWVSSLFKPYPYSPTDGRENLEASGLRLLRGGNWNLNVRFLRTWYRNGADPNQPLNRVGFRCARDANP